MTEYRLINPSDPYTFLAKDKEVAALVVFALSTSYGAESKDKTSDVPVFLFCTEEEIRKWYESEFSRTIEEGAKERQKEIGEALLSFVYGNFKDRARYEAAINAITDEDKKEAFMEKWQESRSSLNNIGTYARQMGKKILDKE